MVQSCYEKHSDKVAISYLGRQFPNYVPNEIEKVDYAILHRSNVTILSKCQL